MSLLNKYDFHDCCIKGVSIKDEEVTVVLCLWNERCIRLTFENLRKLKYTFTSSDIITVKESKSTVLLEEAKKDIQQDEGSKEEADKLTAYSFIDSWGENVALEIISSNVKVETDLTIE